jgi:hypothetical protein
LTAPEAATASSPSRPSITTSIRLTAEVMKNCAAIGKPIEEIFLRKARSKTSFIGNNG